MLKILEYVISTLSQYTDGHANSSHARIQKRVVNPKCNVYLSYRGVRSESFGGSDIHTCENDKYQSGFKAVIFGAKSIFRNAIKNGALLILNWVK